MASASGTAVLHAGHPGGVHPLLLAIVWAVLTALVAAGVVLAVLGDDEPDVTDLEGYSVLLNERREEVDMVDRATDLVAAVESRGEFDRRLDGTANALEFFDGEAVVARVRIEDGGIAVEYRRDGELVNPIAERGEGTYVTPDTDPATVQTLVAAIEDGPRGDRAASIE